MNKIGAKLIIKAITDCKGSISGAAASLGVARETIYEHLRQSKKLKDEVDSIRTNYANERKIRRRIVNEAEKNVHVAIRKSKTGILISQKAQEILNNEKGKYTSIFSLAIDQLKLRELMGMVENQYLTPVLKEGEDQINTKEYAFIMANLHKTYALVTKTAEDIAKMELEGKTPSQVADEMFNFMRNIIETFKELINDENIKRENIIAEFEERIKLREDID